MRERDRERERETEHERKVQWCSLWFSLKKHVRQFTVNPHTKRTFRPNANLLVASLHALKAWQPDSRGAYPAWSRRREPF